MSALCGICCFILLLKASFMIILNNLLSTKCYRLLTVSLFMIYGDSIIRSLVCINMMIILMNLICLFIELTCKKLVMNNDILILISIILIIIFITSRF